MDKKPTYEELEQRNERLKKELQDCKQMEKELRAGEERYRLLP